MCRVIICVSSLLSGCGDANYGFVTCERGLQRLIPR